MTTAELEGRPPRALRTELAEGCQVLWRNSFEERPCLLVGGSASLQGTKIYLLLPFLGHNMSIYHLSDLNGGTPSRSAKSISAKLCEESLTS